VRHPGRIVCPACGSGELRFRGAGLTGCDCCGRDLDKAVLKSIEQIVALPDAIGDHACECDHPEMRRLPDGVFHCPACGSEVLPLEASREPQRPSTAAKPTGAAGSTAASERLNASRRT